MNISLSRKSELLDNIVRFGLDSRIGKAVLSVKGTSLRMGERISIKPGYSPVIMDHRYYEKGDPVKDIDWKLSARTERLFVKIREGYRQTDFVIAPDGSGSMRTSYNGNISKFTTALTLAYIAGRIALKSRDRVFVSYAGERFRADSEYSLMDILTDIESRDVYDNFWNTDITTSANVFVLSDFFIETEFLSPFLKNIIHNTRNLYMIAIQDPYEQDFSFRGRYKFLDPESGSSLLSESRNITERYLHLYNEHYNSVSKAGKTFGAKTARVTTTEDPYNAFIKAVS